MWLILVSLTLHFTRHGIVFPFVPLLAEHLGAGPATIGFIVGSFSLIAVFLSIPLGGLVDRFGVKRLLLLGVCGNIALSPQVLLVLVFTFAIVFAANLRSSFLPVLLQTEGLTELTVGLMISIFVIMSTSIRLIFGRVLEIFNRKGILAVSMLSIIIAVGLLPSVVSVAGLTVLIAL